MEILGKFVLGGIIAENAHALVRIKVFCLLLSGRAGIQWDVTQAIDAVTQVSDYYLVMF